MAYLNKAESESRIARVKEIMKSKDLDVVLVYYDEFNIGNGWYLTGWCPQFESGAVLIPRSGNPLILGGPESEPFAKVGLVGAERMPAGGYMQIVEGFKGVDLVDVTSDYVQLRYIKSPWERLQIEAAFKLADYAYDAMKNKITSGVSEIEVAAVGEFEVRSRGASGFGFTTIVGSGKRSNAVVPTASSKILQDGELVMLGIAPKVNGYAGVVGDVIPVSGEYSTSQLDCIRYLKDAFRLTREQLILGKTGKEIDAPARKYFEKHNLSKYLVCPFVHTIGLHEAESPFFGPNSSDVLKPGMMVCVDVSFFGHPEFNGVRIETGYKITEEGAIPLSEKMDKILTEY